MNEDAWWDYGTKSADCESQKDDEKNGGENVERVSPITRKAIEHIKSMKEHAEKLEDLTFRIGKYLIPDVFNHEVIVLDKTDMQLLQKALICYKNGVDQSIKNQETALECGSESGDLRSHGEKEILQGCVRLLRETGEHFREYLEYIGTEPDEDIPLSIQMQYGHIVKHLFLWNTYHSGGTSTRAKCRELGVNFDDTVEICEDDEDDCETGDQPGV